MRRETEALPFSSALGKKSDTGVSCKLSCISFATMLIREALSTIYPVCHLDCTGTARNSEETNCLQAKVNVAPVLRLCN